MPNDGGVCWPVRSVAARTAIRPLRRVDAALLLSNVNECYASLGAWFAISRQAASSSVPAQNRKDLALQLVVPVVQLAARGYLCRMKLTRTNLWLAVAAAMFLTASCSQAPDAEKDPSADAAYKRANRADGYREAQRSNVTR